MPTRSTPPPPAAVYRRQARRLRARLSDRPAELQRALRLLADGHDAARPRPDLGRPSVSVVAARRVPPAFDPIPGMSVVERAFAARVAERVSACPIFTGTDRGELLRLGVRMGVQRFRASLLIAMQQHAAGVRPAVEVDRPRRTSWAAVVAGIVLVEVAAIGVLWARL